MIAALYIDTDRGPYPALDGVECWGVSRDATTYAGPWPVVAHPPCGAWSMLRHLYKGSGKNCGPIAVTQVRKFRGILEQPAHSKLWEACSIPKPGAFQDEYGGYSISVDQCDFGHQARKKTWLYIVGCSRENLPPMPDKRNPVAWVSGTYTPGKRGTVPPGITVLVPRLRHLTPPAFAAWLVEIARRCSK